MNKIPALILIISFSCNSITKEPIKSISIEGIPAGAIATPYEVGGSLAKVSLRDASGQLLEEGDYLNNKRTGAWTTYHANGFVKSVTSFIDGIEQGNFVELDEKGQIIVRGSNYNGALHGDYIKFNRTRIKEEKKYENGVLEGTRSVYYDNGKPVEVSSYKNGIINGKSTWYDQEGNITIEYEYENGKLIKTGE